MRRAGSGSFKILENAPVYRLNSPTFHVPTKSTAFNPTIIDNSGKMHIDWSNPNIYKAIIPTILTGSTIFGSLKNN